MCTLHIIVYIADTIFTCNVTCACYVCMLHILCMHMIQYECSLFHMWNHTYQCVRCICYVCTLNTQSCMLCITVHTCTWYAMHTGCLICACYLSHMYIICDYYLEVVTSASNGGLGPVHEFQSLNKNRAHRGFLRLPWTQMPAEGHASLQVTPEFKSSRKRALGPVFSWWECPEMALRKCSGRGKPATGVAFTLYPRG